MKKLILILLILLFLFTVNANAATVTRYVDPDATGTGTGVDWTNAYTSLSAWNAGEATDLVTDTDVHIVNCRASSGTNDTTRLYLTGWTTGASNYISIVGDATTGVWDESKYVYNATAPDGFGAFRLRENFVRIENLQISQPVPTISSAALYIGQIDASNDIRITNCLVTSTGTTSNSNNGLFTDDTNINLTIVNSIFFDFPTSGTGRGIYLNVAMANLYNCTITTGGETVGVRDVSGTTAMYNCAVFDNVDDIQDVDTIENCATDQGAGEGTNGVDISSTWNTTCFTSESTGDYTVPSGSPLIGTGQDDPGGALQPDTDIAGNSRTSIWDIGAFESTAAPSSSKLIMVY